MKRFAFLTLLGLAVALEVASTACGGTTTTQTPSTAAFGNWEAQLTGGTGDTAGLDFVITFSVTNNGPLSISGFGFFNSNACFATGLNQENESGAASFTTSSTGAVNGTLSLTVTSDTMGSTLSMTGNLTGTSNGTTTSTGSLSNGVVSGTWTLSNASIPGCNLPATGTTGISGTWLLCQGTQTCTAPN